MKKYKYAALPILIALCCVIFIGMPNVAYAAGDNQLTVSVSDDYYSKPVDGVTITVTNAATGAIEVEQVTDADGKIQVSLPDGTYQIEQTKFKAGYVIDHSIKNVTFSGIASDTSDHQTINIEDAHIMGNLYAYAESMRYFPDLGMGYLSDVTFDIEDEFGNRIATGLRGGQSVLVPVSGSYTVTPTSYPSRLSYNSNARMFDSVFACTGPANGKVEVHAVTFPYDAETRLFETRTSASVILPTRRGNIIVRVVDQYGNPIAGATLIATPAYEALPGTPSPACPPTMGGFNTPDPAYLPGTSTPRPMTQTPPNPGVPYIQTGELDRDANENYLLTTGPDGTVVIPDYLVGSESTITQLTTLAGYTIDDPNPQIGVITGSDETTTVTFVNRKPETPAPNPEPTPEPQPEPKTPKKKKSKLPDTADVTLTAPLFVGVAGTLSSIAGVTFISHKKRF